ncbi:MAG: hypothetical protein ACKOI0_04900 [Actinomycetota bacterium]
MRPGTRIAIAVLLLGLLAAAWFQFSVASPDGGAYPGPVAGTPLPTASR